MSFLITTKYHGPTSTFGSRVSAALVSRLGEDRVVRASASENEAFADHAYGSVWQARDWHAYAAHKVAERQRTGRAKVLTFAGKRAERMRILACAETHDGTGYAFVCEWVDT